MIKYWLTVFMRHFRVDTCNKWWNFVFVLASTLGLLSYNRLSIALHTSYSKMPISICIVTTGKYTVCCPAPYIVEPMWFAAIMLITNWVVLLTNTYYFIKKVYQEGKDIE